MCYNDDLILFLIFFQWFAWIKEAQYHAELIFPQTWIKE